VSAPLSRDLAGFWTGRLRHYRSHRNDEHVRALIDEAIRYVGLHLENDLCRSEYWAQVPLGRTAAILLFLVDRGIVERTARHGRRIFEPMPNAESWVLSQGSIRPYASSFLELLSALRHELSRRTHSRRAQS
jgi:hypothetical protein